MYELKPIRVKCLINFSVSDGDLKDNIIMGTPNDEDGSVICLYKQDEFIYTLTLYPSQFEIIGDDKTEMNDTDCLVPYIEPTVGLEFIPNQQAIKQLEIKVAYH